MIYLDNCSTTIMRKEVIEAMTEAMREDFANASALHGLGFKVEKKINSARELLADYLKVSRDEIFFTSGGTESNNLAIRAAIKKMSARGGHIITSQIEHPSVLSVYEDLEKSGLDVSYLKVDSRGLIDLDELRETLRDDTILLSIMQVNNEIGSIQPLEDIAKLIAGRNIIYHVDGVQGFGKIGVDLKALAIDLYSFSGHKIHGPKGIGGLYINRDLNLEPVIFGGGQERGFRSGTENAPAIIGLSKAAELMRQNSKEEYQHVLGLNKYLRERLNKSLDNFKINSKLDSSSPYIVNISIENIRGEVLLHYLEEEDIYISTSSACSSNSSKKSHVLASIGLNKDLIDSSIRICLSYETSYQDIDRFMEVMLLAVEEIREIMMR